MSGDPVKPGTAGVLALRPKLLEADDRKIRRILAVVDDILDPAVNQALLDPVRHRLASLNPVRPPRFARLLFMPLDPLLVAPRDWRPDEPTLPRSILTPIAKTVRAGIGGMAASIDKLLADRNADATLTITRAGEALWPRAAEILVKAVPPDDWPESGLPASGFPPLAASIAAVLRRAARLRRIARRAEIGAFDADNQDEEDILRGIADEPDAGCAMIVRLLLVRSPHASGLLRRIVASGRTRDEKASLQRAVDRGTELALSDMERESGFADGIGRGVLADVAGEVRRVITLLREIEGDPASAVHWPRLRAIREKLSRVCGERFARGISEGLVAPLAAALCPLDATGQTELETRARELRKLDAVARGIGNPADYDRQLRRASEAVRAAADMGTLTPMRTLRLIELLAGSDVAEALYARTSRGV